MTADRQKASRAASKASCGSCPLRCHSGYRSFADGELEFVQSFKSGELTVEPGTAIVVEGHDNAHLYTILDGWAVRYKMLEDGQRQIVNFSFPGDLIGLQASVFDRMDHSVEALTTLRLCVFERANLWKLFETQPNLAFDVTWLVSRDELMLAQHLANIGRRSARERISYVLLLIYRRGSASGLFQGTTFSVPLTQEDLADMMGLSVVHTNKVLRGLDRDGIVTWSRSKLAIKDVACLEEIAGEVYLPEEPRPFL